MVSDQRPALVTVSALLIEHAAGFYVPGRIEVMGKHTDYAGGRSLLAAASKSFCVVSVPPLNRLLLFLSMG